MDRIFEWIKEHKKESIKICFVILLTQLSHPFKRLECLKNQD